jgi:nicotinamide mononucleotide transporter
LDHLNSLLTVAFSAWGTEVTWLEIAAFGLSVAMVVCNLRVAPVAWPLAIAASLLYAVLFAASRLYGEASLQIFFAVIALWGWHQWLSGRLADGRALQVRHMTPGVARAAGLATFAAWPLLGLVLSRFTDSDVPFLDALPTVASVTGQIALGRKWVENWPIWIAVNLVSIALFAYKGLWLTVALYAVFVVLSVIGWRAWTRLAAQAAAR